MKELIAIQSELKAPKGQFNKFGGYKYRSCEDILEALKPLLLENKCYLVITDEPIVMEGWHYIKATATLTNDKGQSVSATAYAREEESKKGMDGSQITGGSSSYARKYCLNGLFCIDDTKDADATNTHEKEENKAPQSAPAPAKASTPAPAPAPAPQQAQPTPAQPAPSAPASLADALKAIESAADGKALTAIYKQYKSAFTGEDNEKFVNAIKASPVNPNRK